MLNYHVGMIKSFKDLSLREFFTSGNYKNLPSGVSIKKLSLLLSHIDAAEEINDLKAVHPQINSDGTYEVRLNSKYKAVFKPVKRTEKQK